MAFDDRFRFSVHAAVVGPVQQSVLLLRELGGVHAARVQAALDFTGTLHTQVY